VHSFLEVCQHYPDEGPLNDPHVSRSRTRRRSGGDRKTQGSRASCRLKRTCALKPEPNACSKLNVPLTPTPFGAEIVDEGREGQPGGRTTFAPFSVPDINFARLIALPRLNSGRPPPGGEPQRTPRGSAREGRRRRAQSGSHSYQRRGGLSPCFSNRRSVSRRRASARDGGGPQAILGPACSASSRAVGSRSDTTERQRVQRPQRGLPPQARTFTTGSPPGLAVRAAHALRLRRGERRMPPARQRGGGRQADRPRRGNT